MRVCNLIRKSLLFAESYHEARLIARRLSPFGNKKEKLVFLAHYVQTTYLSLSGEITLRYIFFFIVEPCISQIHLISTQTNAHT